jgi:hypothetical protein
LTTPKTEWPVIARETTPTGDVFTRYVMPLAVIGPLATLVGSRGLGIGFAVLSYAMGLASVLLMTFVVEQLSPKFDGQQSRPGAFRLIAYSGTASWLAGIFHLIPGFGWLSIVGLYSIYLFYLGTGPVLGIPPERRIVFIIVVAIVGFVISMVIAGIITGVLGVGAVARL